MGCIKITWNVLNFCYFIIAAAIAFESDETTLEVLALSLMIIHFFFIVTLNGLTTKHIKDPLRTLKCFLLLQNCSTILLTASIIIFTSEKHLLLFALPIICFISPIHIVYLCIACFNHSGYSFLQIICLKRCPSCECQSQNSQCLQNCSKFEDCLTIAITCSCCCKPNTKILVRRQSMSLKELRSKNLSQLTRTISRQNEGTQNKITGRQDSNTLELIKFSKGASFSSHIVPEKGSNSEVANKQRQKAHNSGKVQPEGVESSYFFREGMQSIRALKIVVEEEKEEEREKEKLHFRQGSRTTGMRKGRSELQKNRV